MPTHTKKITLLFFILFSIHCSPIDIEVSLPHCLNDTLNRRLVKINLDSSSQTVTKAVQSGDVYLIEKGRTLQLQWLQGSSGIAGRIRTAGLLLRQISYHARSRYRNVTIWARVQARAGENVSAVVPEVMPSSATHATASA